MKRDDRQRNFVLSSTAPSRVKAIWNHRQISFMIPAFGRWGWRDLVGVTSFEILLEPLLPAMWLAVSLLAAAYGHYVIALGLSFVFFLTGLRFIHNAFSLIAGAVSPGDEHRTVGHESGDAGIDARCAIQSPKTSPTHVERRRCGSRHAEMPAWRHCCLVRPSRSSCISRHFDMENRKLRATVSIELLLNVAWIALNISCLE